MSIASTIAAARAKFGGGPPQAQAPVQPGQQPPAAQNPAVAQPPASAPPDPGITTGAPGTNAGVATGLTMEQLLAQLAEQRPALEQRLEAQAMLFASNLRSARKIYPEAEARVAYQHLTALCDDAQFGGKVLFYQRDASGQEVEVEGTRVQQVENFWAEAMPHSLSDERVAAVATGRTQAFALPPTTQGPGQSQQPRRDASDNGVDMEDDAVLAQTPGGQRVLERRAQQGRFNNNTAPGSNAVN